MTSDNNMDEFEQDQFDSFEDGDANEPTRSKNGLVEAWRNKPVFKLLVILLGLSAVLAVILSSTGKSKQEVVSHMAAAPGLKEAPGGTVSPFFKDQNDIANAQRADQAVAEGGSAFPTPIGKDATDLAEERKDPLKEYREETERLKRDMQAQQAQNAQKIQMLQQQVVAAQSTPRQPQQEDETLARAMQAQMQQLMDSWKPSSATVVSGVVEKVDPTKTAMVQGMTNVSLPGASSAKIDAQLKEDVKTLVPAGTVNYMQLLTEANSDVPGPILAQILSGPLAGGRAIGHFQVMNDYLVMSFNMVSLKGKDYAINGLALDPDTTLGGMATEVDHRYFMRVLLPAAGAFVSAFGDAMADTDTETTISGDSVVVNSAKKGYKEAIYDGLGSVGQTVSQFFQQQANQTKTLVRVAVGTPMGLFFLQPVTNQKAEYETNNNMMGMPGGANGSYQSNVPYPNTTGQNNSTAYGMSSSQMEMFNKLMSTSGTKNGVYR